MNHKTFLRLGYNESIFRILLEQFFIEHPKKMFRKDLDLTRVCESPNLFIICRQIKQFYYKEFYQKWRNNYGDFHIFLFVFFFFLYLNSSFRLLKKALLYDDYITILFPTTTKKQRANKRKKVQIKSRENEKTKENGKSFVCLIN